MDQFFVSKDYSNHLYIYIKILFILLLTFLVYKDIDQLKFAAADDGWMLFSNNLIQSGKISFQWCLNVLKDTNGGQYSPLNTFYYFLLFQIDGYNPHVFHGASIFLHLINGILVYVTVAKLFLAFKLKNVDIMAYIVTVFWLIHPLNVEPVAWISASKVLLFTAFSLASIHLVLTALEHSRPMYFLWSILAFLCACLCKEQAVVMPAIFFIIRLLLLKKNAAKSLKVKYYWFILMTLIISALVLVIFFKLTISDTLERKPALAYSFFERINLVVYCLTFYFTDLFIPINLKLHYPFPFKPDQQIPSIVLLSNCFLFFLIARLGLNIVSNKRFGRFYLFCMLFFFINIFLVLQVVPMSRASITADRYMYLPSVGLMMVIVKIAFDIFRTQRPIVRRFAIGFAMVLTGYYTIYSVNLVNGWQAVNIKEDVYNNQIFTPDRINSPYQYNKQ